MSLRRKSLTAAILVLSTLIFSGCAKVEPPPGGPVDKTGPTIISTEPIANAVNVAKSNKISVMFSEAVDHKSAQSNCFITPNIKEELKYKWHGKMLDIILPDSFSVNTTYIVNIGSSVIDYRSNKMAQSFQFAFTTGQTIDQGKITGIVFQAGNPAPGMTIGLYDTSSSYSYKTFDSVMPKFLTQSGNDGKYSLDYLPVGKYFVLAFRDLNNNKRFDYPEEDYGMPDRIPAVSSQGGPPNVNFNLIRTDTSSVTILSLAITEDRLLKVRTSRKFPGSYLAMNFNKIFLLPSDTSLAKLYPTSLLEKPEDTLTTFSLYFPGLSQGNYKLVFKKSIFVNDDSTGVIESASFEVKFAADKTLPSILAVNLSGQIIFPADSILAIQFSEPIDKSYGGDSMAVMHLSDSSIVPAISHWKDDFRLDMTMSLLWGKSYYLAVNQALVHDMAGNAAGDSTKIYSFKTFNQDSLGSISGTVSFSAGVDSAGPIYLRFLSLSDKKNYLEFINDRSYRLSLPGGKYLLSGFLDKNENHRQDYGSLSPFRMADPSSTYPDTIRVRPRFESGGIDFIFK